MKTLILITTLLLTGCAFTPPRATSIADYCDAVSREADMFARAKESALTESELRTEIMFRHVAYPPREVRKMLDVVAMVYGGATSDDVRQVCVAERTAGTWFRESV